jgi:hypothetical protein
LWRLQIARGCVGGLYVTYAPSTLEAAAGDRPRQLDPVTFAPLQDWQTFLPPDSAVWSPAMCPWTGRGSSVPCTAASTCTRTSSMP